MTGTLAGGKHAAMTNKKLYGDDFYSRIGRKGGLAPTDKLKGFAANPELARRAGSLGGKKSKRGPAKDDIDKAEEILEAESGRD